MPGLAASSNIFEYIRLPNNKYELHFLEWLIPESDDESIEQYSKRLCEKVEHTNPVLVGVSFGGIIVQEMSAFIQPDKIILISSVKNENEMPGRFLFLKKSKIYRLFPSKKIDNLNNLTKYILISKSIKKKIKLYNKYLSVKNEKYINWAIHNLLHWESKNNLDNIIHIHGNKDEVFPIKNIDSCITVLDGTHAMIITKAKKISSILQQKI